VNEDWRRSAALVENGSDLVWVTGADGAITYASPAVERNLGWSRTALVGRDFRDLVPALERASIVLAFAQVLRSPGEPVAWEGRLLNADGDWRLVALLASNHLATPTVLGIVFNARDVTRQKLAEEALGESERRFRSLVENSTDVFWLTDAGGTTLYVSPAVASLLGYSPAALLGQPIRDLVHPDDLANAAAFFRRVLESAGAPMVWQMRARHADGSWRQMEVVSQNRLEAPELGAVVSNLRDVTEHARTREALRESEAQFRAVFDGALDAMVVINDEGRFLEANAAASELWGLPREELLQRNVSDFAEPGFRIEQVNQAVQANGSFRAHHPIHRPDGTVREVEASTTGNIVTGRHFTALRDLTGHRRLEEQLRQSQKMEAVGRLAGGIAHDFNNILAVITGYGDMLQREIPPQDPRGKRVEQIRRAADRAASLVRQLLAFSRRQVLQPRVLDLRQAVRDLLPMLQRLIGEDIELRTVERDEPGRVRADPGQIEQVVMNLVVNARDAMPRGGRLLIETRDVQLDEGWASAHAGGRAGSYVMLSITDTGAGMDAETMKHVFEPFFTTKELGKGTGLGLAMVYGTVKQSGGHVWIYSEPGVGTVVKIYLPRVDELAEPVRATQVPVARKPGTETVLVAEDEESLAEMIREILEELGYTVLVGGPGAQALEVARQHAGPIHLLLTDVVMPGLSGRDLAARLVKTHPEARILYMSGYSDDAIAHHGILEAGVPFIEKPFGPSALASKVRQVLDG
jgi:PAS domain S-box-containing protein